MLACRSGSLSAVCPCVPSGVCILSKDYGFVSAADFYAKQIVVYRTCMCERVCVREGVFEKRLKRNKKKKMGCGVWGEWDGKTVLKEESLRVFVHAVKLRRCWLTIDCLRSVPSSISGFFLCVGWEEPNRVRCNRMPLQENFHAQ